MLALLFAAEVLDPAAEFWIAMAWVSDVALYDSAYGEFDALVSRSGIGRVHLSDVLIELALKGTIVNVVTRPDPSNDKFLDILRRKTAISRVQDQFRLARSEAIHQKNLVGKDWFTDGSMNLTVNGLDHNVENLTVHLDPEKTAEIRTNIRQTWNGTLEAINDPR
jgi:phosphatidylserine/phosphatidylglycerophosphate/cardiolipin synthase-like enzyme